MAAQVGHADSHTLRAVRTLYLEITWSGVAGGIYGTFLSIFALRLGASALQVSLLTTGPAITGILCPLPAVRLVRLCLPLLEQSDAGRILFVTSTTVLEPVPQLALSNAIRPGLTGWAKTLARELGPTGITVNCVAPGRIDTARMEELYGPDGPPAAELAQIPLGRIGTPREFGDVVCFLASARASYISGTTVLVDGAAARGLL